MQSNYNHKKRIAGNHEGTIGRYNCSLRATQLKFQEKNYVHNIIPKTVSCCTRAFYNSLSRIVALQKRAQIVYKCWDVDDELQNADVLSLYKKDVCTSISGTDNNTVHSNKTSHGRKLRISMTSDGDLDGYSKKHHTYHVKVNAQVFVEIGEVG